MQKIEKKQQILRASIKAFFKHGYDKTTVAVICEYADIARATFYQYFKNKQELFHEMVWHSIQNFKSLMDPYDFNDPDSPPWEEFRYTRLVKTFQQIMDNREMHAIINSDGARKNSKTEKMVRKMHQTLIEKIQEEYEAGIRLSRLDIADAEFAATCTYGVLTMITQQYILGSNDPCSAETLARKVSELRGFAPIL